MDRIKQEKGKLVISLDTEIAWGWLPYPEKRKRFYPLYDKTREVIERLIVLFEKYDIPATWAIVGRMIENPNSPTEHFNDLGIEEFFPHLQMDAINNNKDLTKEGNSFISAPDIINKVINSKVAHEIATHSYYHIHFGRYNKNQTELIEKDINAFNDVFKSYNKKVETIVFPRNDIGFKELLAKKGIKNYRGVDEVWFDNYPKFIKKILYPLDTFLPSTPQVVDARIDSSGMVNIPGSMLFRVRHFGIRKNIPVDTLRIKGIKGLKAAAKQKKIFHLWFHPFNFGYKTDEHFLALESTLIKASELRQQNQLEVVCMNEVTKNN